MIVVAVIGILASVAMPKFASMLTKAQEGALKGNLGAIRSALTIYQADNQGQAPTCIVEPDSNVFAIALTPKYIEDVKVVKNTLHPPVNSVYCDYEMLAGAIHDGQGWYYDGALPADQSHGGVWVACDHTDTLGKDWTVY
jgi:type II secretory pathway pseudopilin PulG